MTPTTPSGWYSTVDAWLMAASPLRTRRERSTRRACLAAQSMCTMARMISSLASSSGLPVSSCMSWASRPMYLIRCDFQASSRIRRRTSQPGPPRRGLAGLGHGGIDLTASVHGEGGQHFPGRRIQCLEHR